MGEFSYRSHQPLSAEGLYRWHMRPGAFERLVPPWQRIAVDLQNGPLGEGSLQRFTIGRGPLALRWQAQIDGVQPSRQFVDTLMDSRLVGGVGGPFAHWRHQHCFLDDGVGRAILDDRLAFRLRGGALGRMLAASLVQGQLRRLFRFRHRRTFEDLSRHQRHAPYASLRVLISGASGLIGRSLAAYLSTAGHEIHVLTRSGEASRWPFWMRPIPWDLARGELDPQRLEGFDAVVHLAGESIAGEGLAAGRWSAAKKRRILESREGGTRLLCRTLAGLKRLPQTFICASASGYYGSRGSEPLHEDSAPGKDFLAEVCQRWEAATEPAAEAGMRVVRLRTGMVLSASGGALPRLLPAFRLGLGGKLGDGRQYLSWIALEDLLGLIEHVLFDTQLVGAVNACAPQPVSNAEFTRALGVVLGRPTWLGVPAGVLSLVAGELAEALLLGGQRVYPQRALDRGFPFLYPEIRGALAAELGREG